MQFEGEHLWIGKTGHIMVLIAFTASLLSTIAYFTAAKKITLRRNYPGSVLQGLVLLPR
jgi:hypothetical protein